MAIKSENVKKWIDALRSGQFNQVQGHLGDRTGFCCLGVACEVAIANGINLKRHEEESYSYAGKTDVMPVSVQRWLGTDENPVLGSSSCAELNDQGLAFEDIADMIETEYLAESTR